VNKLKNLNVDYMKIPKTHRGPHKMPSGPHTGRVFETPGLHGCEIACALKQTFAQCKIFLQGTLLVTNFTNLCKHIDNETSVKFEATTLYQFEILLFI